MKKIGLILMGIFISFVASIVFVQMTQGTAQGESKVVDGVKAVLNVTPSMSMVDVVLTYADTGKTITNGKVFASVKGPDGKVEKKELVGGTMGKEFSFMNTLNLSRKGKYSFDITTEIDNKKVKFNFDYHKK
ncbi:MAG: hypothetical protein HZA09_05965 [Nitrospirae bacterium]|nr:hypothetical protein [Nitrospirota bacterium]